MFKTKIYLGAFLVLLAGLFLFSSCSSGVQANATTTGPTSNSQQSYKASWIKANISGNSVSIPVSDILSKGIVNFKVGSSAGELAFMAYQLDGSIKVRADICPPCRSESFTLQNGRLICDRCGTVFDAKTGAGIKGACVRYPKASVAYENNNGTLTMKADDLLTAFQTTLSPKL
jgi:nitrite reductase/ring-hydroxylating ferredoxin subunit